MIASFSIPGPPVAKGRARFARRGNFVTTFTPEKTLNFESRCGYAGSDCMAGRAPVEGPIVLSLDVRLPIPASWSKKKQEEAASGRLRPCARPDVDNFAKAVLDGLNGIVWRDDAQVVELRASKHYSISPRVDVLVMPA